MWVHKLSLESGMNLPRALRGWAPGTVVRLCACNEASREALGQTIYLGFIFATVVV